MSECRGLGGQPSKPSGCCLNGSRRRPVSRAWRLPRHRLHGFQNLSRRHFAGAKSERWEFGWWMSAGWWKRPLKWSVLALSLVVAWWVGSLRPDPAPQSLGIDLSTELKTSLIDLPPANPTAPAAGPGNDDRDGN